MRLGYVGAPRGWYFDDLRRAAAGRDLIVPVPFQELRAGVSAQGASVWAGQVDLGQLDALLVRTMPPSSLEQVVFRMDVLARCEAAGVVVVNPPRAVEAAVDKYLATAKLAAAGLPTPETVVCQTADDALVAFDQLGGDVVLKPVFGGEGRGIARLADRTLAGRAFQMLAGLGAVLYVQRFVPHEGFDVRVLLVGERAFCIRRRNAEDWRTNVSRGATAEPCDLPDEWEQLARRAARAVGAVVAGVDLLPARDGQVYVIEVNASPGWRALAAALDVDVSDAVLEYLRSVANRRPHL